MPVDSDAPVRISAFAWVPEFARGQVRDLRVRWALEEAGIPYSVRKLEAMTARPADYFEEQPFGQVPSYRDADVELFESGAIVLHVGEQSEALLPADPGERARAAAWLFAALNTLEPQVQQLGSIDFFHKDEAWTRERRPQVLEMVNLRLKQIADHLGEREWLEDRFTVGDLMMTTVLRILNGKDIVEQYPNLAAYQARAEARPAFGRALAAQLADFEDR
ncbi:glutathione S-transferase family protein [Sphingomonas sp. M1-B02]|uniref:glutathione S-transferase family protein n=1 Tax=Sphingomonas sp. M1-B02 TaxID=3114300 RepID=UPI00223F5F1F|nr:glutathione S-transferase family protein [Sphingomonas sp. S6-11]UZK64739.1 glutathione S-transferase family protein [Sphingomonas sp. S6-11]